MARGPNKITYDRRKKRTRDRDIAESKAGRDIGDIPPVTNSDRKARCCADFRLFCEEFFPQRFTLKWSPDHLKVIGKIEKAVREGDLFAMAMPRGSGKTTLCEVAVLWAVLTGCHRFVFLIGSCEDHATSMLSNLKSELQHNELLAEDFPEAIYPIRCLENQSRRCVGQLHHGEPTYLFWGADRIILPSIPGSRPSGAVVRVAGLTGNLRGALHTRPSGESIRPTLVVCDDPQTDQSARSPSQCASREAVLAGAVLGLAGPGEKIAGLMPLTVISQNDMADRILDRDKNPRWQGERTRMVYSFPTNEKLWEEYAEILANGLRSEKGTKTATAYYRKNRKAMDAGAKVAWPERHNHDEISAVQNAMNLKFQDEAAFQAEYQNEPLVKSDGDDETMTATDIASKTNGMNRAVVPIGATRLTMFIDVHDKLLYHMVVAWQDDFTGYVIDYGSYPEQDRKFYTLRDSKRTMAMKAPGAGLEGWIYAGLEALTNDYLGREWVRDGGSVVRIDRCLIDANWGASTDTVYQFCRQSSFASVMLPSHGKYVGASSLPFSEYKKKIGDRVGHNWRVPNVSGKRSIRHAYFDTNYWKTFVHTRLGVPMGDKGCLSLFGRKADAHRLLSEHLTAEYRVKTEGRGRTVDEWKTRPDNFDNHWLDCLVGCAVGASLEGSVLFGTQPVKTPRKRYTQKDLRRRA